MRKSKLALKGLVGGAGVVLLILFTISTKPASALFWETTIPSEMPPVDYTPFLNSSDNPLDILNQIFWGATETGSPPPPPISFDQLQDVPTVTFSNPESAVSDFVTNFLKIADLKGLTSAENNIWYLNYANKYHYFYYDTTTNTLNYVSYSVPSQGSTISVILWKYKKIGVDGKGPYGSGKGGWFLMGKTEETNTSITDGELRLLSNPRGLLVEFGNDEQNFSEKFDIKKQGENGYYIYGLVNRFDGDFISDVYDYTTGLILVKKEGRNLFDADDWYYNYNKNTVVRYKKNDQGEITDLEAKTFQKLPDSDPKKIGIDPLEGQSPQIDLEKAKLDTIKKKIEYALGLPEGGLTNEAFLDALLKANYKDNYIFELDVNGQHLLFNLKSDGTINRYIKFNPDNTITVYQPIESGQDYSIVLNNTLFDKIKDHIADLGSDNNLVDLILSGKLELNYDYKRLITKDKAKNKFFWAFDVDETGSLQFISSIREGQSRLFITDSAGKLIVEIFNIPPEAGTGKAILSNFEFNPEDKKFSLRVGNFIRVYNLSPYIGREVDLSKPKSELPYEEKPVIDIEALGEEGRAFLQQILGMSTEEVKSMLESGNFELKNDYLIVKKANGEIYIFDYRKDSEEKNVLKTDYYYSLNNQGLSIKRGELVPQHTGGFKFRVEGTITLADKTTLDNIMKILGIAKGQPVSLDALAGLIDFSQLDPTNIWEDGKFKVEKIQLGISFDIDQKIDGNDRFVVINLLSSEDKKSLRLNSAAIGYAEEISEGGQTKTLITKIEVYDGTGILKFALGDREKIKAIFDGEVTPQNAIDKLKLINYDSQSGTVEINGFIFKTDAAGTASTDVAF
ncbi:MAG: hypothetical protein NC920_04965 [Candidatus Omnitrophica bacterium]|nr:hypothetical protein [Candidatus Omnitrophota bacterium]